MAFRFQNHVLYEQLQIFVKDLFNFTGRLPSYEQGGLIKEIRGLGTSLLQGFAAGFTRSSHNDPGRAVDHCISTTAKISSLIDLCFRLGYTDTPTHDLWINSCQDLVERLYTAHKSIKD